MTSVYDNTDDVEAANRAAAEKLKLFVLIFYVQMQSERTFGQPGINLHAVAHRILGKI